jgi:hypothetical protein
MLETLAIDRLIKELKRWWLMCKLSAEEREQR